MIILKTLEWSNWFSYGENNSIDFSADTLTQLLGSNGVGKSSIPLILEEVLYGKNSKGIKKADIPNRNLPKATLSAKLTFSADGVNYEIKLQRKSTLKLTLLDSGNDISHHTATATYKKIERILGMDFKTFTQLIYQSSSSNLQFLTATDATRKAFLIGLFGLDKYTTIYNVFKLATKDITTNVNEIRGSLSTTAAWIKKANNMSFKKTDTLTELDDPEKDREDLANKTNQLANIKALNIKINNNNTFKEMLSDLKPTNSVSKEESDKVTHIPEVREKITINKHSIKTMKSRLKKLNDLKEQKCPTCMQLIDQEVKRVMEHNTNDTIEELSNANIVLSDTFTEYTNIKSRMTKYNKDSREFETIWSKIDQDMQDSLYDADELADDIASIQYDIKEQVAKIKEIEKHNRAADIHNHKIDTIMGQLQEYNDELNKLNTLLSISEDLLSSLEILKKSFSTTGLISYKLEYLVKDLEFTINNYLAELSGGKFLIDFSLKGDKLIVGIIDEGNTVNIASLSTGQLARVNTATLLAIRKLMSNISKSKINILFLDETLSALDSVGRDGLIDLLLEETDLNTFLVSHEYQHPLLAKIEITMEDGVSHIANG